MEGFFMVSICLRCVWVFLSLTCFISQYIPWLKACSLHGKLQPMQLQKMSLYVLKSSFKLFYGIGSVWNVSILLYVINTTQWTSATVLVLILLQIHLLRRLYESIYITFFGNSTMHILGTYDTNKNI